MDATVRTTDDLRAGCLPTPTPCALPPALVGIPTPPCGQQRACHRNRAWSSPQHISTISSPAPLPAHCRERAARARIPSPGGRRRAAGCYPIERERRRGGMSRRGGRNAAAAQRARRRRRSQAPACVRSPRHPPSARRCACGPRPRLRMCGRRASPAPYHGAHWVALASVQSKLLLRGTTCRLQRLQGGHGGDAPTIGGHASTCRQMNCKVARGMRKAGASPPLCTMTAPL